MRTQGVIKSMGDCALFRSSTMNTMKTIILTCTKYKKIEVFSRFIILFFCECVRRINNYSGDFSCNMLRKNENENCRYISLSYGAKIRLDFQKIIHSGIEPWWAERVPYFIEDLMNLENFVCIFFYYFFYILYERLDAVILLYGFNNLFATSQKQV